MRGVRVSRRKRKARRNVTGDRDLARIILRLGAYIFGNAGEAIESDRFFRNFLLRSLEKVAGLDHARICLHCRR